MGIKHRNSLLFKALKDMKNNLQLDSGFSRVEKIKTLLKIPKLYGKPEKVGYVIDKIPRGKFERFFLYEINERKKIGADGCDHNKLRLYKSRKGCFKQEPYVTNILNINQRVWPSRYRTSAHNLRVESGRYTSPVLYCFVPLYCKYLCNVPCN